MRVDRGLACGVVGAVSLLALEPAQAQNADSDRIEQLQIQTEQLQKQIKALREEMARTKKKTEEVESAQAKYIDPKSPAPMKAPAEQKRVTITPGGWIAGETVFRTRNTVTELATPYQNLPFPFQPTFGEREFHASARQSRLSVLIVGDIDTAQKLSGYVEGDFQGVAGNSNYNETNSWAPRLRQGYFTYDNTDWGFHFLAGQAWSLLTQNTVGITPRKENIPLAIDTNIVLGFAYTRQMQIRFVQDFGSGFWLGVSVENSATINTGGVTGSTTTNGIVSSPIVNGLVANIANPGAVFLNTVTVTPDVAPDFIVKAAFDPGWGHYEVFGLQRFFTDNVFCINTFPTGCVPMTTRERTTSGTGVGGSFLVPVWEKYLDLQGSVLYGRGVSRYSAGQLPDVTIAPDASLAPLTGLMALVGAIAHPWDGLDVYAYGGYEQLSARFFNVGVAPFGFGNPNFSNLTCLLTTQTSFTTGVAAAPGCVANNRRLWEATAGFWQNLYKGDYGRVVWGAQYAFNKREVFAGLGGAPKTDDNTVWTSIRWYPWP
jgi:hypothetical protein